MTIDTIAARLRGTPGAGPRAARAQFIAWLLAVPEGESPARAAQQALTRLGPVEEEGEALRTLAECLEQTQRRGAVPTSGRRRARGMN